MYQGTGAVFLLVGILACLLAPSLISPAFTLLPLAMAILAHRWRRVRGACLYGALGFSLAYAWAGFTLNDRLDNVTRLDTDVLGQVVDLPVFRGRGARFLFAPEGRPDLPRRIRLSWINPPDALGPGSRLQVKARLKSPRGFRNPGLFDYERWLFSKGIGATGYVREGKVVSIAESGLDLVRWRLAQSIWAHLGQTDGAALAIALTVGYRGFIPAQLRDEYQRAGTAHLIAISGLHVALVSGLVFLLVGRLIRLRLFGLTPVQWAALAAIATAGFYAAMAGFALPTLRAWLMLSVGLGALLLRRNTNWVQALYTALFVVLAMMPASVLEAGFWLSFGAVAVLLWSARSESASNAVVQLFRVQLALFAGLVPALGFWFGLVPLWSPLVNAVAIPLVGTVAVPIALCGALLSLFMPETGASIVGVASWVLQGYSAFQAFIINLESGVYMMPTQAWWVFALAAGGVVVLLSPAPTAFRLIGGLLLLPALAGVPESRKPLTLTVADVGQGQAILIATPNHTLIYDAGPRFLSGFDTGAAIVAPLVNALNIDEPDVLLVSHDDLDHSGGLSALRNRFPRARLVAPTTVSGFKPDQLCREGDTWRWDGVLFSVLHPGPVVPGNDNNASCVLKIIYAGRSVLLTGDIESSVEAKLVRKLGDSLNADVLLLPHHGSRSSSSAAFLSTVAPDHVLISAGWGNRWHMPHREVIDRLEDIATTIEVTAAVGAITVEIDARGVIALHRERRDSQRLWSAD